MRRATALVTGGAGFIGCNLAHRLARDGRRVIVLDDLSRPGVERNLAWLAANHSDRVETVVADIRDDDALRACVGRSDAVFHLAAQVAVTSSLADPAHDFAVNAVGTFRLLEAVRSRRDPPPLVFTSTNKVYGALPGVRFVADAERYLPLDAQLAAAGVGEDRPLAFTSPYGCSKGAADQYVVDYARSYDLPATVLRMSCIYGPHQMGTEDQGWVAHFVRRVMAGEPVTLYGDGRQVRDVLFIDDLVDALMRAEQRADALAGHAVNIGGGPANAVSLLDLLDRLHRLLGRAPVVHYGPWRTGDQPWYVADTARFSAETGWHPRVGVDEGLGRLVRWFAGSALPASLAS